MIHNGTYFGMHFFWWIFWVIIIVGIIIFSTSTFRKTSAKETPLDILKKRFANGEISKEEFEEAKKVLNSNK